MDLKQIHIRVVLFILIFLFLIIPSCFAYKLFTISLPDNYGLVEKEKTFYIGAGEPAFGLIYDLKPPAKAFLLFPDGTTRKLPLLKTEFIDKALNTKRLGYTGKVVPKIKGDYYVCVESDYTLLQSNVLGKFLVKTPFHVSIEKSWDSLCGFDLEIKPFTRPYGFREKAVFWGQVWYKNKPLDNGTVEVEKFSPDFLRQEDLPKDSYGKVNYPYLKKITKLTKNGFFIVSLEEPGWWVITVKVKDGKKFYGNNLYPVELIHLFWVYVFPSHQDLPKYEYFPLPSVTH